MINCGQVGVKISICIFTFNRCDYLKRLLSSILREISGVSFSIQVVVSDNCSTDDTFLVCQEARALGLPLKYVLNHINIGAAANISNSVNCADGEYCMLMGDDDELYPGVLKLIGELICKYTPDVFIGDRFVCDVDMNRKGVQKCGSIHKNFKLVHFSVREEIIGYFSGNDSLIGVFSFVSTLGFKRSMWGRSLAYDELAASYYPHVYKLMDILVRQRGVLMYMPVPIVYARVGDEVLASELGSMFRRYHLDFMEYGRIAQIFFKNDSVLKKSFFSPIYKYFNKSNLNNYLEGAKNEGVLEDAKWAASMLELM